MNRLDEATEHEISVVQRCHDAMDRHWRQLVEKNSERPLQGLPVLNVVCQSGCAACCTYVVDAVSSEAIAIAAAIEHTGGADKLDALERLHAWEREFLAWERNDPMPDPNDAKLRTKHILWRMRWQVKRIACPFLNMEDYSCGAYDMRPATCRAWHATTLPADAVPGTREAPEGCFTDPKRVRKNALQSTWQLDPELTQRYVALLARELQERHFQIRTHVMPLLVLIEGRRLFGWSLPRGPLAAPPRLRRARLNDVSSTPIGTAEERRQA